MRARLDSLAFQLFGEMGQFGCYLRCLTLKINLWHRPLFGDTLNDMDFLVQTVACGCWDLVGINRVVSRLTLVRNRVLHNRHRRQQVALSVSLARHDLQAGQPRIDLVLAFLLRAFRHPLLNLAELFVVVDGYLLELGVWAKKACLFKV